MGFCRIYPMILEPVVEIRFCRVVMLCNEPLRRAIRQQALDFRSESIQLAFTRHFGPTELETLFFFEA